MNATLEKLLVRGGVRLARESPLIRRVAKETLAKRMRREYEVATEDKEALKFQKAFGISLFPFLENIVLNKPRAARGLIDFSFQWVDDIQKREKFRNMGLMAPDTYVVEPTDSCNLKCPGCYASSEAEGDSLSYKILERIDDEMRDIGVSLTTISGGEPFIRERKERAITRLAEHALRRGNRGGFLVYTNGTLIDDEVASRLGDLGNVWPAISIEGFEESTKKRRGERIIEQIKRAKESLKRHGVMYGFSATANCFNADEIASDRFFEERLEEGDSFGWIFIQQPIGRGTNPDEMVIGEQRYKIGKKVLEVQLERKIPMFIGDFWNYGPFVEGCIAGGKYYFHIKADGAISPCVFSSFGVGNLKEIESFAGLFPFSDRNGHYKFKNLQDFLTNQETLVAYREAQREITDRFRPCVLIDHPALARRVFCGHYCFPTKNTPEDYLKGRTAEVINQRSEEWKVWADKLRIYTNKLVENVLKER